MGQPIINGWILNFFPYKTKNNKSKFAQRSLEQMNGEIHNFETVITDPNLDENLILNARNTFEKLSADQD